VSRPPSPGASPRAPSAPAPVFGSSAKASIDWGRLAPLRLRARQVADGVYAGAHRSARRGTGVELGGFREYAPGDDLRWLDRRSLLRHDRLVIRQFETETDRALAIVVDASASMAFRGPTAPGAKIAFAALVAASLSHVALSNGDPVSLAYVGGEGAAPVRRGGGREHFERVVASLESLAPGGDATVDGAMLERALQTLARTAKRGAIVVVLSDLLDLPGDAAERVAALAPAGRVLVVVQVLDPAEVDLPFSGTVRLRALEGGAVVETDADVARPRYIEALEGLTSEWREAVLRRGGSFVRATTADDPVDVVRAIADRVRVRTGHA
jgi:uncharacterized protein (DUF58 family)